MYRQTDAIAHERPLRRAGAGRRMKSEPAKSVVQASSQALNHRQVMSGWRQQHFQFRLKPFHFNRVECHGALLGAGMQ